MKAFNLSSVLQQDLELTFLSADKPRKPVYNQMHVHSSIKLQKLSASPASLGSFSFFLTIMEVTKALLNTTFDQYILREMY